MIGVTALGIKYYAIGQERPIAVNANPKAYGSSLNEHIKYSRIEAITNFQGQPNQFTCGLKNGVVKVA